MSWTKTRYPASIKKLPAAIRNQVIAIANTIVKENKKNEEDKIISTALRRLANDPAARATKAGKKKRTVAKKKLRSAPESRSKSRVRTKAKKSVKTITPVATPFVLQMPFTPKIVHGEDLHLIPVAGELHPVRIDEGRKIEAAFHHNEATAFRQENQRVKESMSTRKNSKPIYRNRGRRS